MELKKILEFPILSLGDFEITLLIVFGIIFVLIAARIFVLIIRRLLKSFFQRKGIDPGRQYAVQQVFKYLIYTIALLLCLQVVGLNFSLLWGGAAALLVGVGLGLQQTFNDLVSGIIILIEGTVEVGDTVFVDGMVAKVVSIGIRTSKVENRDHITIIIPNSKLVVDNVVNWTSNKQPTRFNVDVGVAYKSEVAVVNDILLKVANENQAILKTPPPTVQLINFGNSSLDFRLLFYSNELFRAEFVKSELRFAIFEQFRLQGVEIPFPQQDLWIKNPGDLTNQRPISTLEQ